MKLQLTVPAQDANGNPTGSVGIVVESEVLDAAQAAQTEGGFDTDAFCKKLTGFSFAEIEAAFQAVQRKDHWKNPITVTIPNDRVKVTVEAIKWFHADEPTVTPNDNGTSTIKNRGYMA